MPVKKQNFQHPDADDEFGKKTGSKTPKKFGLFFFFASIGLLILGALLVSNQLEQKKKASSFSDNSVKGAKLQNLLSSEPEKELTSKDIAEEVPLSKITKKDIENYYPIINGFLEAKAPAEILSFIRDSDRVSPLVEDYYERNEFKPLIDYSLDVNSWVISDHFISFNITLADHSIKPIAVELVKESVRVDWESWVGYSEENWEKFIENKQQKPTLMRLLIKPDFYFNYDFSNSQEWACFELLSDSNSPTLYGYVKRGSEVHEELKIYEQINPLKASPRATAADNPHKTAVIQLAYPPEPKTENQVLITGFLFDGWVEGLKDSQ